MKTVRLFFISTAILAISLFSIPVSLAYIEQGTSNKQPGEQELTSGTFIAYLSKKKLKEDSNSVTYRYFVRLTDSAQTPLSGAVLSFEGFDKSLKGSFMKTAKELGQGSYEIEISLIKAVNWDITILGKHDPYPFRMNFREIFIEEPEKSKVSNGEPYMPGKETQADSSNRKSVTLKDERPVFARTLLYLGIGILILGSAAQKLRTKKTN